MTPPPVTDRTNLLLSAGGAPDDLAEVVLGSLDRPAGQWTGPGVFTTLLLALPTFGLLPLVVWPIKFREFVASERSQFQNLADWVRLRGPRPAAVAPVRNAAADIGFRPLLSTLAFLCAAALFAFVGLKFLQGELNLDTLIQSTYAFHKLRNHHAVRGIPFFEAKQLFHVWTALLCGGYFFHWLQVRWYAADVKRFVGRFDAATKGPSAARIRSTSCCGGGALWTAAAVIMCCYGLWWAIPMALAGRAQQRYTDSASGKLRAAAARRVKDMLAAGRTYALPQAPPAQRCANSACAAVVPVAASFCPRCGTRTLSAGGAVRA